MNEGEKQKYNSFVFISMIKTHIPPRLTTSPRSYNILSIIHHIKHYDNFFSVKFAKDIPNFLKLNLTSWYKNWCVKVGDNIVHYHKV